MISKNDELTVTILDLGVNGEGVAKVDGAVVFVPFALPNEVVKIHIIHAKSHFYVGKIVEILTPSPARVTPPCPHFFKCGGCDLQHMNHACALNFKTNLVINALKNIGKVENAEQLTLPCISKNEFYYRNKFSFPVGTNGEKSFVGMYKKNSHEIIEIKNCHIQMPWAKTIIEIFNNFLNTSKNIVYNEQTKQGLIKHLVCRMENNQLLVCVVVNGNKLNNHEMLIEKLKPHFKNFGLMLNVNKLHNNVILSNTYKHLYGIKTISLVEDNLKYETTLNSFMQVNSQISNLIYGHVQSMVENEIVVNAFSGSGFLSGLLAKTAKHVYGIEIVESAHLDAETLKTNNNIENLTNILGDVSEKLKTIKEFNTIVLDPPRKGVSKEVVNTILSVLPKTIIYISCNPSTLARDVNSLTNHYNIISAQPYDMFPQTKHVETVVKLELKQQSQF